MREIIIIILAVLVIGVIIWIPINLLTAHSCKVNASDMGKDYKYSFVSGCRIEHEDGKYVNWQMYRQVELNT